MTKTTRLLTPVLIILMAALFPQVATAQEAFGRIEAETGVMTIIRSGESLVIPSQTPEILRNKDLVQAGTSTQLNWQLDESTRIQLGSSSIVMIRPWKRAGETGYLTLGYGAAELKADEERVLKTPAAVLHSSGISRVFVAASGNTIVAVKEGLVSMRSMAGKSAAITNGQFAMIIDGELVSPDPEQAAGLSGRFESLEMPPLSKQQSLSLPNESELLGSGVISVQQLQNSKNPEADATVPFDIDVESEAAIDQLRHQPRPVSSQMATDLAEWNEMTAIDVETETSEFGTIRIRESRPDDVFVSFTEPKSPGQLFDLDDKTSWTLESGLIEVTIEK